MTNAHDDISVGDVTLVYSAQRRGWIIPGGLVIQNPIKVQRLAERLKDKVVTA
ncbi:hypothetical protein DZA65_03222 [Dickeya dianthicola]|uniref:DUF1317 family protein n=1 Tax=Dickeya dianthicola TaxID=204039 RepID=UPI000CD43576|nr:DUF1317 family protein [Dickeya dianthicola]AYC20097.1 hypothetical protein DZA65_03222 [Dickeya dianthicola]MBI0438412.1 DUF1317 family protein [Dickeya dianthicola]MBI0450911.1 DUF1317 family protein [Dickeya dianthicola]MBI0454315.1 DUF1317 family protein [Dickeya dianthicola]MBI0458532.1 DUF1317 family protein [Dickeya dianthicola]